MIRGSVRTNRLTVSEKDLETGKVFREKQPREGLFTGCSIALVVTPGKRGSGELYVADRYQPETVVDLAGLKERAAEYGCLRSLENALNWLGRCGRGFTSNGAKFPMAVILCARRPFHLIGQASEIELVPYIVEVGAPELLASGDQTPVFPAAHRHSISSKLLCRMSGVPVLPEGRDVVLVGCGSVGSKIAIHLARSGAAPSRVVDRRSLSPHNAARHALLPHADGLQITWTEHKAEALAKAIAGLGQPAEASSEDVTRSLHDDDVLRRLFPRRTWAVINATASLAAREALAAIGPERLKARVLETSLLAGGAVGVMTVEGPNRNPNCGDLAVELYEVLRTDDHLRQLVFEGEEPTQRHEIGEGCGSMTIVMPDATVSLFAAAMAEGVATMRTGDLPIMGGRLLIGRITEDGIGLSWVSRDVPPVQIVQTENGDGDWVVRLLARAHEKIIRDCAAHANVETGGVLVGRTSETQRAFLVTDVLPAPEDSIRTPSEFVLGTRGVLKTREDYSQSCVGALYCLGTWHSHPVDSGPSGLDRRTARTLAIARSIPSVMLIRTPSGYRALVAKQHAHAGRQEET